MIYNRRAFIRLATGLIVTFTFVPLLFTAVIDRIEACLSRDSSARFGNFFSSISPRFSMNGLFDNEVETVEVTRLNAPGQRFTATHGIEGYTGSEKLFL